MAYRDQKTAIRKLTEIAITQGGYFTAKQARKAGYQYSHLDHHVRAKNFERVGQGLYRVTTIPFSEHDDLMRLWLWSRARNDVPQAVVSHQTALTLYNLSDLMPSQNHLTVPPAFRKKAPKGVVLHRSNSVKEQRGMYGFQVTSPYQTFEDLSRDTSITDEQFDQALNEAIERGLVRQTQARHIQKMRYETHQ
jgi:predicted transcriptional regulator of viral defense system